MHLDLSSLRSLPVHDRLAKTHPFLQQVGFLGKNLCDPQGIIVFGSRARGDHRSNSDFDIAFKGVIHDEGWARLLTTLHESAETLLDFDLVRYEELTPEFRHNIDKEGIVIYERRP